MDIIAGAVFEHDYPFVRDTYQEHDEDGTHNIGTWRPGVRWEMTMPDSGEACADGVGKQRLTVIGTYKPGRFPERIFYVRTWIDPRGKEFGNTKLRITTKQAFMALAKGYRHEFRLEDSEVAA